MRVELCSVFVGQIIEEVLRFEGPVKGAGRLCVKTTRVGGVEIKAGTTLLVSHRLTALERADRILVLYKGEVVEQGTGEDLFERPQEAYTQQLLQSIPGRSLLA